MDGPEFRGVDDYSERWCERFLHRLERCPLAGLDHLNHTAAVCRRRLAEPLSSRSAQVSVSHCFHKGSRVLCGRPHRDRHGGTRARARSRQDLPRHGLAYGGHRPQVLRALRRGADPDDRAGLAGRRAPRARGHAGPVPRPEARESCRRICMTEEIRPMLTTKWAQYADWTRLLPEHLKGQARRIGRLLVLGFALRIVLLPLFGGEDAVTTAWISTTLMAKGQLILSNDPAPIFYLHALIFAIFRPIYPATIFNRFVSQTAFTPPEFFQISILREPGIGILLALLKLPYLLFDLSTAILLLWLIRNPQAAVRAFKIWLFNPVVLYLDKERGLYERAKEFLRVAVASVTPFALQFLIAVSQPVFYESANYALSGDHMNGFFGTAIYNRGKPGVPFVQGMLTFIGYSARLPNFSPIPDVIYLLPMSYLIFLVGWAFLHPKDADKLWNATVGVFLLIYYFSLFHPQWFLWVQPFLIALVAREGKRFAYLYAGVVTLFFVYIWWWDSLLTTFLLVPSVPAAASWPGPMTILNSAGLPTELILNLARSAFSALCLAILFLTL